MVDLSYRIVSVKAYMPPHEPIHKCHQRNHHTRPRSQAAAKGHEEGDVSSVDGGM